MSILNKLEISKAYVQPILPMTKQAYKALDNKKEKRKKTLVVKVKRKMHNELECSFKAKIVGLLNAFPP